MPQEDPSDDDAARQRRKASGDELKNQIQEATDQVAADTGSELDLSEPASPPNDARSENVPRLPRSPVRFGPLVPEGDEADYDAVNNVDEGSDSERDEAEDASTGAAAGGGGGGGGAADGDVDQLTPLHQKVVMREVQAPRARPEVPLPGVGGSAATTDEPARHSPVDLSLEDGSDTSHTPFHVVRSQAVMHSDAPQRLSNRLYHEHPWKAVDPAAVVTHVEGLDTDMLTVPDELALRGWVMVRWRVSAEPELLAVLEAPPTDEGVRPKRHLVLMSRRHFVPYIQDLLAKEIVTLRHVFLTLGPLPGFA